MLDTDTKRRIDTARDILVGKVPDPKSQVEQITIALIYKFMDDKDTESEEFGCQRKSFLARTPGYTVFSLDNLILSSYFLGRFSGTFLACIIHKSAQSILSLFVRQGVLDFRFQNVIF